jgi:hypothetical protein
MSQEPEMWSPDHDLRLLEELAEAEDHSFDLEMDLAIRGTPAELGHPWRAYWHLPPSRFRSKARGHSAVARRR